MRMRGFLALPLLLVTTSVVACSALPGADSQRHPTATPGVSPADQSTATITSMPPSEEPTRQPTPTLTEMARPTATFEEHPSITFESGEISTTLEGQLDQREMDRYALQVPEGQRIEITVEASGQIGLTVRVKGQKLFEQSADQEITWRGDLPAAEDAVIELTGSQATTYILSVTLVAAPIEPAIEVITPKGGEVWLEGTTHTIVWDSWGVEQVDIEAASGGKPWVVAVEVDAGSGQLPWQIPVGLISNFGVASSDAMHVRVFSTDDPDLYDENDEPFTVRCPRIQFEPGATAATVTGALASKGGRYRYAIRASAGQTMQIEISPPQFELNLWGPVDGSTWHIPTGESELTVVTLPATQDYFITLTNPSPDQALDYVLDVSIE